MKLEEQTKKNLLIIGFILVVISIVVIGIIIIKSIFFSIKEGPITFGTKDIQVFEETTLNDLDIHKDIKIVENKKINTEKIGSQKIKFIYTYKDKKYYGYIKINIIDNIAPTIFINNSYTLVKGNDKDFLNSIISGDNYDNNPTRKIIGEYDKNKVGTYRLKYYISDSSGNETIKDFKVKVIEKKSSHKTTSTSKVLFSDVIKKHKNNNTEIGIDVSKWQGTIDFEKVKASGCEFVIIRLGHQKGIDGELIIDPYFKENIKKAKEANLKIGVYLYTYAKSIDDAKKQAKWVIDNIKDYGLEYGVSYDWESWSLYNKLSLSFYNFNKVRDVFLEEIENHNYQAMLYSSKYYLENIWYPTKHQVWLAHYTSKTNYQGRYEVWQMTSSGRIDGINGNVDINIAYKFKNN